MKFLLAAALLMAALSTQAQTNPFLVRLNDQQLGLPSTTFHIARVLDLRPDRSRIGWVHQGLINQPVPANLMGGVAAGLTQWLSTQLPARAGTRPVIVRVHELSIEEEIGPTSEHALATLDIDFAVQQHDSSYIVVVQHLETIRKGGLETTGLHDDNLAAGFRQAIIRLQNLNWPEAIAAAKPLPAADYLAATDYQAMLRAYPILLTAAPSQGMFATFEDFRSNQPDTRVPFTLVRQPRTAAGWQGTEEVKATSSNQALQKQLNKAWGFSDGQQAYIRYRNHLYLLERAGHTFEFTGPGTADAEAVAVGAVVGGLAGAAIASAATGGSPHPYSLSMRTGRVLDNQVQPAVSQGDTAQVVLFRRGKGPAMVVQLTGQMLTQLPGNGFVRIPWTSKTQELQLCLPETGAACLSFVPDFTATTYVEIKQKTAADKPTLVIVPAKEGIFYTKKMQPVR
ncbi:hypothetical protein LRS06_03975 [Hymenobacter sp. J193]|uniref:hypothetical protein n=1 Tax=Hymenobacter sp. J193 TaxID=2898429 RepID=UPI00215091E4|nr:hypothetical protein [Hymenobacter sp. J193]MCR5886947.1 hypothetical protein [Hymenobacter sp. J193]